MGVGDLLKIDKWRVELTYDEDGSMPTTLCSCGMVDERVALAFAWAICHTLVVNFVWRIWNFVLVVNVDNVERNSSFWRSYLVLYIGKIMGLLCWDFGMWDEGVRKGALLWNWGYELRNDWLLPSLSISSLLSHDYLIFFYIILWLW